MATTRSWSPNRPGRAAQHTAARLKRIAQRQVKNIHPRRQAMPIQPTEQLRRFQEGAEVWRLEAGQVTPGQWRRYVETMQGRMMEGR